MVHNFIYSNIELNTFISYMTVVSLAFLVKFCSSSEIFLNCLGPFKFIGKLLGLFYGFPSVKMLINLLKKQD